MKNEVFAICRHSCSAGKIASWQIIAGKAGARQRRLRGRGVLCQAELRFNLAQLHRAETPRSPADIPVQVDFQSFEAGGKQIRDAFGRGSAVVALAWEACC